MRRARLARILATLETRLRTVEETGGDSEAARLLAPHAGPEGKFLGFLTRSLARGEFRVPEDLPAVAWAMGLYLRLRRSPQLAAKFGVRRQIDEYGGFRGLLGAMQAARRTAVREGIAMDQEEAKRQKSAPDEIAADRPPGGQGLPASEPVYRDARYEIERYGGPGLDREAGAAELCRLSAGTEWCLRKPAFARGYLSRAPIYLVREGGRVVALVHLPAGEGRNRRQQFVRPDHGPVDLDAHPGLAEILAKLGLLPGRLLGSLAARDPSLAPLAAGDAEAAVEALAASGRKGRWPEAEPAIAADGYWAVRYMKQAGIRERWPAAEPAIAKSPEDVVEYAELTRAPFPAGEATLLAEPKADEDTPDEANREWFAGLVARYAKAVGRWPEGLERNPGLAEAAKRLAG